MTTIDHPAPSAAPRDRARVVLAVATTTLAVLAAWARPRVLVAFVVLFVVFLLAERRWGIRRQRRFRPSWWTDVAHFFVNGVIVAIGTVATLGVAVVALQRMAGPTLARIWAVVDAQPVVVQFVEALLVVAVSRYWSHRLTHRVGWLWRFHAVHHSSAELDWLASVRLHPVDAVFAAVCTGLPLYLLGFDRTTFGALLVVTSISPFLDHANLRLRLPVLRWLVPNPEWHHWHHALAAIDADGDESAVPMDRNFSPFPFVDVLFGTHYLPNGRWPHRYGIASDEAIPSGYLRQLAAPFRTQR